MAGPRIRCLSTLRLVSYQRADSLDCLGGVSLVPPSGCYGYQKTCEDERKMNNERERRLHNSSYAPHQLQDRVVFESLCRYNQVFITRATRQWDIDGQGRYDHYIRAFVALCWDAMTQGN